MDTIKFANGAVHSCSFLATTPNDQTAYIALDDVTFAEAAALFSDENATETMEYNNFVLIGYTSLQGLLSQPYGIQAILKGGYDERIE